MKKLMYIAAALLVLVGCNKNDNIVENAPEGTPFEKGQKVTLTIGTGAQQGPNRVAGVDNTIVGKIDFTWEEGDKILVKVGEATAEFTLTTGAGSADGEFTGTMPAAGSTFDIQYPIEAPDLTAQVYSEDKAIPADKMLFTATGCTLGELATLTAQYAMVQLNLYGTDKTVGKIVFTNTTADPDESYTLTCTGGKTIAATSATATPFYMIVPAGEYQFEVEIWDNTATPAMICSFATSAAQTFVADKCLNMPAKEVADPYNGHAYVDLGLPSGLKWATMNVGATAPEDNGDYFAWGETETKTPTYNWSTYKWCNGSNETLTKYCIHSESGYNEFTDGKTALEPEDDAAAANWKGAWRMPTKAEFEELANTQNCEWKWCDGETEKYNNTTVKGYLVTSVKNGNSIFLPASGSRSGSTLNYVGFNGLYWSSTLKEDKLSSEYASSLNFATNYVDCGSGRRFLGQSVRPVCE